MKKRSNPNELLSQLLIIRSGPSLLKTWQHQRMLEILLLDIACFLYLSNVNFCICLESHSHPIGPPLSFCFSCFSTFLGQSPVLLMINVAHVLLATWNHYVNNFSFLPFFFLFLLQYFVARGHKYTKYKNLT